MDVNENLSNAEQLLETMGLTGTMTPSKLQRIFELRDASKEEELAKKYEKSNPSFVQIYKGIGLKSLALLVKKKPVAGELFLFFLEQMNNKNVILASQQLLMEETGKKRTTIHTALKYLEEHNYINIAKIGSANVYIVNPQIAFQDSHDKKKYVSFEGTVLLSKEENKALFEKFDYENIKVLNGKEKK